MLNSLIAEVPHRGRAAQTIVKRIRGIIVHHGIELRAAAEGTSDADNHVAGQNGRIVQARAGGEVGDGLARGFHGAEAGVDNIASVTVGGAEETLVNIFAREVLFNSSDIKNAFVVEQGITQLHPSQLVVLAILRSVVRTERVGTELGGGNVKL